MIRKHTRRAVKAAFCVAIGVAIVLGGLAATASSAPKSHLKTLYDLQKLQNSAQKPGNFSIGARPEFKNREEGFLGMKHVYGLTKLKYVSIANGLTYQALDQKQVFCINVFSTDAQLA